MLMLCVTACRSSFGRLTLCAVGSRFLAYADSKEPRGITTGLFVRLSEDQA